MRCPVVFWDTITTSHLEDTFGSPLQVKCTVEKNVKIFKQIRKMAGYLQEKTWLSESALWVI